VFGRKYSHEAKAMGPYGVYRVALAERGAMFGMAFCPAELFKCDDLLQFLRQRELRFAKNIPAPVLRMGSFRDEPGKRCRRSADKSCGGWHHRTADEHDPAWWFTRVGVAAETGKACSWHEMSRDVTIFDSPWKGS
jgi:hypothetical protein